MAKQIYKHTVIVTVLSEHDDLAKDCGDEWDLESISYQITHGSCIGDYTYESVVLIPPQDLEAELIKIGNDGTFFDDV